IFIVVLLDFYAFIVRICRLIVFDLLIAAILNKDDQEDFREFRAKLESFHLNSPVKATEKSRKSECCGGEEKQKSDSAKKDRFVSRISSPLASPIKSTFNEKCEKEFKVPRQFKSCDGTCPEDFLEWLAKLERTAYASDWSDEYKCWLIIGQNKVETYTLVDNGSLCNIMRVDFMHQLQKVGENLKVRETSIEKIRSLSMDPLIVLGEVYTTVTITKDKQTHIFETSFLLVKSLPYDILLGAEAMKDGSLIVDVASIAQVVDGRIPVLLVNLSDGATRCKKGTVFGNLGPWEEGSVSYGLSPTVCLGSAIGTAGGDCALLFQERKFPGVSPSPQDPVVEQNNVLGSSGSSGSKPAVGGEVALKILGELISVSTGDNSVLSEKEKSELIDLLVKNANLFVEVTGHIGRTAEVVDHLLEEKDLQKFHEDWPNNWSVDQWEDPFCLNFCRYFALDQLPTPDHEVHANQLRLYYDREEENLEKQNQECQQIVDEVSQPSQIHSQSEISAMTKLPFADSLWKKKNLNFRQYLLDIFQEKSIAKVTYGLSGLSEHIESWFSNIFSEKHIFDEYWGLDHDLYDEDHKAQAGILVTQTLDLMLYFLLVGEPGFWPEMLQQFAQELAENLEKGGVWPSTIRSRRKYFLKKKAPTVHSELKVPGVVPWFDKTSDEDEDSEHMELELSSETMEVEEPEAEP
uniref:Uncharacterized protein n=1 Tax=Romanomermis culicivorax TaxID=13658 RepID=A0A915IW06_ROMCU